MLKRCSPFYQEVSALEYCYWYFSSHMYSFTFSGKDWSLPRQKSYKKKKKKKRLWEAAKPPACQGDHRRLMGCPSNLTDKLMVFLARLSSWASVLPCVFLETKMGTWLPSSGVTLEAGGKNIWNWGFLRTLGKAASFPQPTWCLGSAHSTTVWCVSMGHPFPCLAHQGPSRSSACPLSISAVN